jgi:hypothetical protein
MVSKLAVRLESLALDIGIQKSNALYLGNADYFDRIVILEERLARVLALRFSRSFERRFKAERGPYNEVKDLVRRHLDSVVVRLAPEPTRFEQSFRTRHSTDLHSLAGARSAMPLHRLESQRTRGPLRPE